MLIEEAFVEFEKRVLAKFFNFYLSCLFIEPGTVPLIVSTGLAQAHVE